MNFFKNLISKSLLLSLLICLSLPSVFAEDSKVGRLPDGRAFRTDAQGFQLVDYIAELELEIEELKNKLISQANEQRMAGSNPNIQEADLLTGSSKTLRANQAEQSCPESNCEGVVASCRSELAGSQSSLAALQTSNESLSQQVASLNVQVQELGSGDDSEVLLASIQDKEVKIAEQRQELAMLTSSVSSRDAEISSLQSKLANQASLQSERANAKTYVSSSSRASVSTARVSASAGSSSKRESAFEHLKQQLFMDLQEAESLFADRRSLEASYRSSASNNGAKVSLSSMKTKDGSTLGSLRQFLEKASKFSQLGKIQKNIYVMRRALKSDVAILTRLSN